MTDFLLKAHGHYVSGRGWSFGLHITSTDSASSMLTAWHDALSTWWSNGTNGMKTLYPTGTVLDNCEVITLNAALKYQSRTVPSSLALAGTSTDDGLPDRNSLVISMRAATLGKGDRGRVKLPAPVFSTVVAGEFDATPRDRAGGAFRDMAATLTSGGATLFVFNRIKTISKPTPLTKTTLTVFEASSKVGSVARRVKHAVPTYG